MTTHSQAFEPLKPCPFCGAHARLSFSRDSEVVNVRCVRWGRSCMGAGANEVSEEKARAAWNRRAALAQAPQAVPLSEEHSAAQQHEGGAMLPTLYVAHPDGSFSVAADSVCIAVARSLSQATLVPSDAQIAEAWKAWPKTGITSAARAIEFVRFLGITGQASDPTSSLGASPSGTGSGLGVPASPSGASLQPPAAASAAPPNAGSKA